jgi:predicted GNAT superfamily acetyltransferase
MDDDRPRHAWLEVPTDFPQLLLDAPALAASWHAATREHFQWAVQHGYAVTGLHRDPVTSRSFYVLDAAP